ncbi:MAG: succinate dehydrogenase [Alphaproteobacteria bacterium]|nr:succinate dehydrogenase [Alphaproteobacteria bacterium]
MKGHRREALWYAYILHRLSGLALALFLPFHFTLLALALKDQAALDGALRWTQGPAIKLAEFGLVFLLAVHLFGGLRLMALEFLPWSEHQKTYAALAAALAFLVSGSFLLNAI